MGFASAYIEKRVLFPQLIKETSDDLTGIIVAIPSFNERSIAVLLDSLSACCEPVCGVEVIVIVNAPAGSDFEIRNNNRRTIKEIESWKRDNSNCFFRLFAFLIEDPPVKDWGVGLARKTAMDEAVRRFSSINRPDGLIVNLDADCQVESNYFVSLSETFSHDRKKYGCSIFFEHPLYGNAYHPFIYSAITLYELHLRYYFQGLAYSGFPYVFHTVGSSMAVRADAYVKAGGMNRRQAGEDFYFIQKLVQLGGYFNLNTTTVYPSPRTSSRVPFGTGAMMARMAEDNVPQLETYCLSAFRDLRSLFSMTDKLYYSQPDDLTAYYSSLPESIRLFLCEAEWVEKLTEIRNNTSGRDSFRKRFFGWFNMFTIVKYMNLIHRGFYKREAVESCASALLEEMGIDMAEDSPAEMLLIYRSLERSV